MEELKKGFPEERRLHHRLRHHALHPRLHSGRDLHAPRKLSGLVAIVVIGLLAKLAGGNYSAVGGFPVAVLGTFSVMAAIGFSLNNISLFGLVLAIGIVVDDAIVVVENVERWMARGLPPRKPLCKAVEEVTWPIIAMRRVLCVAFIPCVHYRDDGAILPPVRHHHRGFHGDLDDQLADVQPGNRCDSPPAALGETRLDCSPASASRVGWFFWLFNWVSGIWNQPSTRG